MNTTYKQLPSLPQHLRELRHSHSKNFMLSQLTSSAFNDQHPLGTTSGTTPSSDFMGFYGFLRNIGRVLFPPDFQFDLRLVGDGGLEPPTPCL